MLALVTGVLVGIVARLSTGVGADYTSIGRFSRPAVGISGAAVNFERFTAMRSYKRVTTLLPVFSNRDGANA
jgi:hypothetical protein